MIDQTGIEGADTEKKSDAIYLMHHNATRLGDLGHGPRVVGTRYRVDDDRCHVGYLVPSSVYKVRYGGIGRRMEQDVGRLTGLVLNALEAHGLVPPPSIEVEILEIS